LKENAWQSVATEVNSSGLWAWLKRGNRSQLKWFVGVVKAWQQKSTQVVCGRGLVLDKTRRRLINFNNTQSGKS